MATAWSTSYWSARIRYVGSKRWLIAQAAVAAGGAYWIAHQGLGHEDPFVAPLATVVSLGTTYGQRRRRVLEATAGICLGLLLADGLVVLAGGGVWQLSLVVALEISIAMFLGGGPLLVSQAAVQAIVFVTVLPANGQVPARCIDAAVGGGVALLAATLVPRAALRSPLDQVETVAATIATLLRGSADGILHPDTDSTLQLLHEARSSDPVLADLRHAAEEGMSAAHASPFLRSEGDSARRIADLVEPLDLALRNTRVLVRRVTVAAVRQEPLPRHCAVHCVELADLLDRLPGWLHEPASSDPQSDLVSFGRAITSSGTTGPAEVVFNTQLRAVVADLLRLTGLTGLESTRALAPALPDRTTCGDVQ